MTYCISSDMELRREQDKWRKEHGKQCKFCPEKMSLIGIADNPNTGYAFNIYFCDYGCSALLKESVWKDKSDIWITEDNRIIRDDE